MKCAAFVLAYSFALYLFLDSIFLMILTYLNIPLKLIAFILHIPRPFILSPNIFTIFFKTIFDLIFNILFST